MSAMRLICAVVACVSLGAGVALAQDCNGNGLADQCDLSCGAPAGACDLPGCGGGSDCNSNGVPDDCELAGNDCNANGVPDDCDIDPSDPDGNGLVSMDCGGGNGVPDECENDCNANGVPDSCDVAQSAGCPGGVCTSGCLLDADENCIPDECGACCGPLECLQIQEAACESLGEYRGDGTACDAENCNFIPTVSQWGLASASLLLLAAGSVVIGKRQRLKAT